MRMEKYILNFEYDEKWKKKKTNSIEIAENTIFINTNCCNISIYIKAKKLYIDVKSKLRNLRNKLQFLLIFIYFKFFLFHINDDVFEFFFILFSYNLQHK